MGWVTGGGWCAPTVAASPSLLFFNWNESRLRPGVAIAGAAVVTGRAGVEICAVAFLLVGVARTAPALGGAVDAVGVGTTAAAAAAAVCVCECVCVCVCAGGGAGSTAAAVGGGFDRVGLVAAAADSRCGLQSSCLSCCPSRTALRFRKDLPALGRRPVRDIASLVLARPHQQQRQQNVTPKQHNRLVAKPSSWGWPS
eukprot:1152759-Pelagomonas_calceolata.AAC.2